MRCFVCNAEMTLMNVVEDGTMPVHGFEWRTFMCSACGDVERRLVFTKHAEEAEPAPVQVTLPIADEKTVSEHRLEEGEPEAPFIADEQHDSVPVLGEREPESVQMAPSIADEQTVNEPMLEKGEPEAPFIADEQHDSEPALGEREPEPAQMAPSIADEQTVKEPMPGEGDVAPIAPASTSEDRGGAVTSSLIKRVMAKMRGR
jgi:hypothetical protein